MRTRLLTVLFAGSLLLASAASTGDTPVPYPEGYRNWTHLHSTFLAPKHSTFNKQPCQSPCVGGVMHFYANAKAMEGFRTGKFPDGAVIADDVREYRQPEGQLSGKEGPVRGVGVMVKDSARYAETGGWGYGAYSGDSKVDNLDAKGRLACHGCHTSKKDKDYVFTEYKTGQPL